MVGPLAFGVHGYGVWGGDITQEAIAAQVVIRLITGFTQSPPSSPKSGQAYMGVTSEWLTTMVAKGIGEHTGALVDEVAIGSPAEQAGIRTGDSTATFEGASYMVGGDVVVSVDGVPLTRADDLGKIVERHKADDLIPVRLWRDDQLITVMVKLAKLP